VTGGEDLDNTALLARIASVNLPEGAFWDDLGEKITKSGERIERARRELRWDIDARIQQRLAQSLMAPFLLLLGAVLAVTMKTSVPLVVYLVAFLPSIVAILLISTGEQELREGPNVIRELVLWSGNVLLLGVVVLVWMRMRRH
jgi:lipopolysaccharide export LptBFGC system permease protein LptF